jgi:hypothetical protein
VLRASGKSFRTRRRQFGHFLVAGNRGRIGEQPGVTLHLIRAVKHFSRTKACDIVR